MRYAILLASLIALIPVACDGGGDEAQPTATLVVTATAPAPSPSPVAPATAEPTDAAASPAPEAFDSFRDFAPQIEAALEERDVAFFVDAAVLSPYTCTDQALKFPVCHGHEPGDEVEGFSSGFVPGHGEELITLDGYRFELDQWFAESQDDLSDDFGPGAPSLYALAHRPPAEFVEEAYVAIVTSIRSAERRTVDLFRWQFEDGIWRHTSRLENSFFPDGEGIVPLLTGDCARCGYDHWERWDRVGP